MIRIVFATIGIAGAMAGSAMAQTCLYDWYGRVVCMQAPQYQQQQYRSYYNGGGSGSRMTSDPGPVIDNSGGCEGGSCVNFGPGYR
jgi:hypothetical protein